MSSVSAYREVQKRDAEISKTKAEIAQKEKEISDVKKIVARHKLFIRELEDYITYRVKKLNELYANAYETTYSGRIYNPGMDTDMASLKRELSNTHDTLSYVQTELKKLEQILLELQKQLARLQSERAYWYSEYLRLKAAEEAARRRAAAASAAAKK